MPSAFLLHLIIVPYPLVISYDDDLLETQISMSTYQPFVLAVYSPSPSLPMGTCAPAPPADPVDEHDLASAVATAMLLVADRVERRMRVGNFMIH